MAYKSVCVVTVTYGQRWQFLSQVLQQVLSFEQVAHIVVVDNASGYNINKNIADKRIIVLVNTENTGSAGGYKQGIEYAHTQTGCDFIWLLDDDNLPHTDALNILLKKWQQLPGTNEKKALFCLREDRAAHVQIARGADWRRYYLLPNNFLGFHLFRVFKNQYKKLTGLYKVKGDYKDAVVMPYVPYGGFLLHKDAVNLIGYPDEAMFLYVDDSEYTYRITQNGGQIYLIPAAKVVDIDKSQGINYVKRMFHEQLLDEWSFRTYYHIRNRIYFYAKVANTNKFIFNVNKVIYLTYLCFIGWLSNKSNEFEKLKKAVNDGLNGRLGKGQS